jgi:hypothetical protein
MPFFSCSHPQFFRPSDGTDIDAIAMGDETHHLNHHEWRSLDVFSPPPDSYIKVAKYQKVFSILTYPPKKSTKSLSVKFLTNPRFSNKQHFLKTDFPSSKP